ncbi:MAG: putative metal-dependent hydrolase [Flavobacteriaceae bacterium]|nr:putative metal-dependent hydrolase [Flavobacteriaceae bacterium]
MDDQTLEKLRYPIGKFEPPNPISEDQIVEWIKTLEAFPGKLEELVINLNDSQLDTPYRPGGWTIRQVVHHLADSHTHSYIRFKWALTEDCPVIKYYYEQRWAELEDAKTSSINLGLDLLRSIHNKLVYLLKSLSEADLNKSFVHPEYNKEIPLKTNIGIYAWHCEHHYAHIKNLLNRKGWV